jgi:ubiquinone/menaquinone biosynthesis C-methylase UbiE
MKITQATIFILLMLATFLLPMHAQAEKVRTNTSTSPQCNSSYKNFDDSIATMTGGESAPRIIFGRLPEARLAATPDFDPALVAERKVRPSHRAQSGSHVKVVSIDSAGKEKTWARTDRLFDEFSDSYSRGLLEAQGQRVLDIGAGDSPIVEILRRHGVEAFGLDIHLSPAQKAKPFYIEASADQTTLAANQFDKILSGHSLFAYYPDDPDITYKALKEFARILKEGGEIRIEPASRSTIEKVIQNIPELRLVDIGKDSVYDLVILRKNSANPRPSSIDQLVYDFNLVRQRHQSPTFKNVTKPNDLIRTKDANGKTEEFLRTNRALGSWQFHPQYREGLLEAKGKKVLDAGCGDGAVVEDLRAQGVHAFGLDIHLSAEQAQKNYFLSASMDQTTLASNQFDYVITGYSGLLYLKNDLAFTRRALTELARILKPGGELRIQGGSADNIAAVLADIPELKFITSDNHLNAAGGQFIKLQKIGPRIKFGVNPENINLRQ